MLDKMTYTNHINEVINFGSFPYFANTGDLRDYSWDYTETNSKILSFSKGIREYSLPVVIICLTADEGTRRRNDLFEITEKDVLSNAHGTLQIGDYKMQCFIKESKKSDFLLSKKYMLVNLTVVTDRPYWTKEKTYTFTHALLPDGGISETKFLDIPYDTPYDYTNDAQIMNLFNENFVSSAFRITIYGACLNPRITVNGHIYEVTTTVEDGQSLVIDSIEKTVNLLTRNGGVVNKFNARNKSSYIFEKIPVGNCILTRSDDFRFDLTLIEERGEPKWT